MNDDFHRMIRIEMWTGDIRLVPRLVDMHELAIDLIFPRVQVEFDVIIWALSIENPRTRTDADLESRLPAIRSKFRCQRQSIHWSEFNQNYSSILIK